MTFFLQEQLRRKELVSYKRNKAQPTLDNHNRNSIEEMDTHLWNTISQRPKLRRQYSLKSLGTSS